MKYLFVCLLFVAFGVQAQTFEKNYDGYWADTFWQFSFHTDGTYQRKSSGHYGQTDVKGTYVLVGDSLHILSGHADSHGTIGEWYVFDDDSLLVDLHSLYEYRRKPVEFSEIPLSIKRYDISGEFPANDSVPIGRAEYIRLLEKYAARLKAKSWESWTDDEQIIVIRLFNSDYVEITEEMLPAWKDFRRTFEKSDYELFLRRTYEFTLSRGGGLYFPELKIEFGGELHPYSYFTVE